MTVEHRSTVAGVFQDQSEARKAVAELRRVGFSEDQIGVVMRENPNLASRREVETDEATSNVGAGAATGAIAGASVGALWALGIVTLGLPAVGPIVAGGVLASILASAAGTAVAGGIVGALIGLGIPEEQAHSYESEFRAGRTIVTVQTADRYRDAENVLHNHGAYNVHTARPIPAGTV
jgi:outer membrane lipoprotein SlyB